MSPELKEEATVSIGHFGPGEMALLIQRENKPPEIVFFGENNTKAAEKRIAELFPDLSSDERAKRIDQMALNGSVTIKQNT